MIDIRFVIVVAIIAAMFIYSNRDCGYLGLQILWDRTECWIQDGGYMGYWCGGCAHAEKIYAQNKATFCNYTVNEI